MRTALILLSILQFCRSSCPSTSYELVRNGECRGKQVAGANLYYDKALDYAVTQCQKIQGQPAIIHDDDHQTYYKSKVSNYIFIGLTCNTRSKRWEWIDGSSLDYKPASNNYDKELDDECTTGCAWWIHSDGKWYHTCSTSSTRGFDIWCTTAAEKPAQHDCDDFNNDSKDGACYQIGAAAANWADAQMACRNYGSDLASIHNKEENAFLRNLAVSKGTVNGLYLGGTISGKGTEFGWIDGTDWDYTNFYPGFPYDGLGNCLTMDTFGVDGKWMNMDCETKLPVACIRQPNASVIDQCSPGPWKEGQVIYSPGYPYDASVPCDYFLTVDAGKRVEVKVQLLEANTCCDHLIMNDSYLAGNIVANLTGEISAKTYTTKSSNLMRVSWQPNGGVGVRGFMMTYRAV